MYFAWKWKSWFVTFCMRFVKAVVSWTWANAYTKFRRASLLDCPSQILPLVLCLPFKALPMTVPDSKTVYAVYLHSATVSNPGGVTANVTKGLAGTAVVEYSGVVVIAPGSQRLTVQEGGKVRSGVSNPALSADFWVSVNTTLITVISNSFIAIHLTYKIQPIKSSNSINYTNSFEPVNSLNSTSPFRWYLW